MNITGYTCEITQEPIDFWTQSRTTDLKDVRKDFYDEAVLHYMKSQLSLEEVREFVKRKKKYNKFITDYAILTRKNYKNAMEQVKELEILEDAISQLSMNKTRECLSMEEHLDVMKSVLENLGIEYQSRSVAINEVPFVANFKSQYNYVESYLYFNKRVI